ncbi:hypothetical protein ABKN59_009735 [Abortiporus biennis]
MHRIFQVPEILNIIFGCLDGDDCDATLSAVARTCKVFEEIALENLWHTQSSLIPLLRIAPDAFEDKPNQEAIDSIKSKKSLKPADVMQLLSNRTFYGVRPLLPSESQRIYKYSSKIKRFETSDILNPSIDAASVFPILFNCDRDQHLFSNLRFLDWPIAGIQRADDSIIVRFMGPKLTSIDLYCFGDLNLDMAVIDILRNRCHMLSELAMGCTYNPGLSLALRDLFDSSNMLRRVDCDVELDICHVVSLSKLPNLEALEISLRNGAAASRDVLSSPPSAFPSLESLVLHSNDFKALHSFFQLNFFGHLSSISLHHSSFNAPRINDIENLFKIIAKHCCPDVLNSIVLEIKPTQSDVFSGAAALTGNTLKPLFHFSNIKVFKVRGEICYNISDSDIENITTAWPLLRLLFFDPDCGLWPSPSLVSLRALHSLANNCSALQSFGALLEVKEFHMPMEYCGIRRKAFRHLHVGPSEIIEPDAVGYIAATLSELFYGITSLHSWVGYAQDDTHAAAQSERWKSVYKTYVLLSSVRLHERKLLSR